MFLVEFNFLIGGEAGQGVQSMGYTLAMTMAKGGYYIFANQDYESRIRGGHNFFKVRVSDRNVQATSEEVNIIIALNEETIDLHKHEITEGGLIIYDGERVQKESKLPFVAIPFERLAFEKTGNRIMGNTVALGAVLGLIGYDLNLFTAVLRKIFGKKSEEVSEKNVKAAKIGYDYVHEKHKQIFKQRLKPIDRAKRMVINGVEAVALGALAAGCKFMSGYPMTPSTGILQYFAARMGELNVVFEQAEDEIAALNMVLGASYVGVRAMTATSGGGFSHCFRSTSRSGNGFSNAY